MTDHTDQNAEPTVTAPNELDVLKSRALQLGIPHHPSIGIDKLRIKVNAYIESTEDSLEPPKAVIQDIAQQGLTRLIKPETQLEMATRLRKEANKLIRIMVTCRNPQKAEWDGEIFTVGNSYVGSIKKYVPFNNEEGWHVPQMIYNMMKERECQIFVNGKDAKGKQGKVSKIIPEFAIEVLTPLTRGELDTLAKQQAMAHSID